MKKTIVLFAAAASLLFSGYAAEAQTQKIAIVNLQKVFDGYWKTKQANLNLKERANELDERRKEIIEDHKKANDGYKRLLESANDKAVSLTEQDRRKANAEAKLREMREIEESIKQFDRSARAMIGEQQRNLRDKLVGEIREALAIMAKAQGFNGVFDSSAPLPPAPGAKTTPFLLFNEGLPDLTPELVKQMNASAPAAVLQNNP